MAAADDPASPPDLALLFATNATDVEAQRIFVNRLSEQQAFDEAVASHHASTLLPGFDSQDVSTPRRNVLVYYGVGGSGKTTLSRELTRRHSSSAGSAASGWPPWENDFESVTARIDLASEAGLDLERVLMSLRVAIGGLGRPMHAFDIAMGRYWEQVHPNESIAAYLRSDSRLARMAETLHVPEQITGGLADVASALGGPTVIVSMATNVAVAITNAARRKLAMRHAVQGCRRLVPLLASEPDLESLSYYPYLLSWDLAQAAQRARKDFHVAIFLDTFEDVSRGEDRRFERLMNRLVWLMPNVLFVVCTRSRLDWGDTNAEGQLDFAGPAKWPGLVVGATGEPSQHLVGYLSPADADKFLRERLRRGAGRAIPEAVRSKIAQESEGYPLYLDLAVVHYLQLAETGVEPQPDDFTGGFPQLVTRVLRDLPADERRLIRILSLLDAFDAQLATAIAQLPSEATAVRLSRRSFVDTGDGAPFPCAIHRLLREQIRESDTGPDAFTSADWRRYAGRSFEELGVRFAEAGSVGNRPLVISLLNQALRIADEFDLPVDWTTDAAYAFIQDNLWEDSLRPLVRLPPVTAAGALAQALSAITGRQTDGRRRTATALTGLLESGLLSGDAKDLATYYAAEALREIGDGERSESMFASLISSDSRIADLAAKGMVHRLRRSGRFTEALDLIRSRPESGMWTQMTGTLYWAQGMLDEAKSAYLAARDRYVIEGRPGHVAEVSGCLAFVCGLSAVGGDDADLVAEGNTVLRQSRNTWARLMARLGAGLLTATGEDGNASQFAAIEADGQTAGLTSIEAYARFSVCLDAALSGDEARLLAARAALSELGADDFQWLVEVVDFWLGTDPSREDGDRTSDWLGGVSAARARWRQIVADRRHGPGSAGITPGE